MNAAKQELDSDIYQMLIGDLRGLNPMMNLVAPCVDRAFQYQVFIASERNFDEVTTAISQFTFEGEFSIDVDSTNGMMAIIRVRIYEPNISIEGLT